MSDAYGAPKKSAADRGKKPEDEVRKYLKAYDSKRQDFDWARNYDSHSAGGRFQRQTGDFQFYSPGVHGVIEVKEVKHAFRVPHQNLNENSAGKLWKRQLAGGTIVILVYHSVTGKWRVTGLERFRVREGGSWDLSNLYEYHNCATALDSLGLFV